MDPTAAVALKALDGLYLRQMVAADNLANAQAAGFSPSRVDFEASLRAAGTRPEAIAAAPVTRTPLPGTPVRIDQEVAGMSQTTLQYQLLLTLLDTRLAMQRAALEPSRGG